MFLPWFSCLLVATTLVAQGVDPTAKGLGAIHAGEAYDLVNTLAGKAFGGRHTGTTGYTAAAKWAANRLASWGLKPLPGTRSMLQAYPQPHSIIDHASLKAELGGVPLPVEGAKDFMPMLYADNGKAKGRVVFAGWGIHAPELGYDDYADLNVQGAFILCFRGTPDEDPKWMHHDEHRTRMAYAKAQGALGLIYIYPEVLANPNGDRIPGFYPGMMSETLGGRILASRNVTVAGLKKRLRDTKQPASMALEATLEVSVQARHFPKGKGFNIVGWVPGSDPTLAHECVVVGGHFDGVGEHMGIFFPGADDNASGSAVVMEAAKALAAIGTRPKRAVIFALFGSEEQGGQGSAHFVKALPPPFTKITAMLNFDMQGVGEKAYVSITPNLEGDRNLLTKADEGVGVVGEVDITRSVGVRSGDIVPFFNQGAGVVTVFSMGERPPYSYHLPGDNISIIQPKILGEISKLAYRYSYLLADR